MNVVVAVFILPLVMVVVGAVIRSYKGAHQTAATDLLVVFILLDGAMLVDTSTFIHIFHRNIADDLRAISIFAFLISALLWGFCMLDVEPMLAEHYRDRRHRFPFRKWLFTWVGAGTIFVSHVALFTGRLV